MWTCCSTISTPQPVSSAMPAHDREQPLDDDRCEAEAHLVDEQALRFGHERPRHRQHLLLAAREQTGLRACRAARAPGSSSIARSCAAARSARSPVSPEPDVLLRRSGRRTASGPRRRARGRRRATRYGGISAVTGSPEHRHRALDRREQPARSSAAWSSCRHRSVRAARRPRPDARPGRGRGRPRCRRSRRAVRGSSISGSPSTSVVTVLMTLPALSVTTLAGDDAVPSRACDSPADSPR